MAPPRRIPGLAPPSIMPMTEVQLRQEMKAVLNSAPCRAIGFTIGALTVDGTLFGRVAGALFNVDNSRLPKHWKGGGGVAEQDYLPILTDYFVSGGAAAEIVPTVGGGAAVTLGGYEPGSNTFIFPFSMIGENEDIAGTVVHECVHAGVDSLRFSVPELDNEAAARLAKELYLYARLGGAYRPANTLALNVWLAAMASGAGAATAFGAPPRSGFRVPEEVRLWLHGLLRAAGYEDMAGKMTKSDGTPALLGKNLGNVGTVPKRP